MSSPGLTAEEILKSVMIAACKAVNSGNDITELTKQVYPFVPGSDTGDKWHHEISTRLSIINSFAVHFMREISFESEGRKKIVVAAVEAMFLNNYWHAIAGATRTPQASEIKAVSELWITGQIFLQYLRRLANSFLDEITNAMLTRQLKPEMYCQALNDLMEKFHRIFTNEMTDALVIQLIIPRLVQNVYVSVPNALLMRQYWYKHNSFCGHKFINLLSENMSNPLLSLGERKKVKALAEQLFKFLSKKGIDNGCGHPRMTR